MKSAIVRARIDEQLKVEVEQILNPLGLSMSKAIELFMAQISLQKGIPFEVKLPNPTTLKTFKMTDNKQNLVRFKNSQAMFDQLDI